jgi:hypothetical protein
MIDRTQWTDPLFNKRHRLASERAKTPALLTDEDIATLDVYDGGGDLWRQRRDDAIMANYAKAPAVRVKAAGHARLTSADLDALVTSFNAVVFDTQATDLDVKGACDVLVNSLERAPVAAMEAIVGLVTEALRAMNDRNIARNEQIAALERSDAGVWDAAKTYLRGDKVTYDGHYFVAQRTTASMPTEGGNWRLVVRRGKQGKDGRAASPDAIDERLRHHGLIR